MGRARAHEATGLGVAVKQGSAAAVDYGVYVIELRKSAAPAWYRGRGVLYVGQSWLTPPKRYRQHRGGIHASRWVRRYGKRLRRDLEPKRRVRTRAEAEALERRWVLRLERMGYWVHSN